jgi:thioredoxin reductase (NADPH)
VNMTDRFGRQSQLRARKVALSIGYYDLPNIMGIPGESLSKVQHYYHDPHPYSGMEVAVIGGKNSAAIAALELWRHGARVTVIYRGDAMQPHIKYWIKPDIENRIKNGEIKACFSTQVIEITPDAIVVDTPTGRETIPNDFVFAMTGYHPDFTFLERLGVRFEGPDRLPVCDPETLESNVPGIYLAGVIVAGSRTSEIFIENGRFHGGQIAASLSSKLKPGGEMRDTVAAGNPLN